MSVELVGSDVQDDVKFYIGDTPTNPDVNPTVVVRDITGATISTGTASPWVPAETGRFKFLVPAATGATRPDILTFEYTAHFTSVQRKVTSRFEIVGGRYFSIQDLRNSEGIPGDATIQRPLTDVVKWPHEIMRLARVDAEVEAESIMRRAWVPRVARERLVADADGLLRPSWPMIRTVRAAVDKATGAALNVSGWTIEGRHAWLIDTGMSGVTVDVVYEHGADSPEWDVMRATMIRARHHLAQRVTRRPGDVEQQTPIRSDQGTIVYATAGVRWTGNKPVDAVYHRRSLGFTGFA